MNGQGEGKKKPRARGRKLFETWGGGRGEGEKGKKLPACLANLRPSSRPPDTHIEGEKGRGGGGGGGTVPSSAPAASDVCVYRQRRGKRGKSVPWMAKTLRPGWGLALRRGEKKGAPAPLSACWPPVGKKKEERGAGGALRNGRLGDENTGGGGSAPYQAVSLNLSS